MENKESGATRPVGICEKLFNALHLNPTFRPLRRIAYQSQETAVAAAAKPASLPPALSAVRDGPAPPTSNSSGYENSSGAAAAARQVSAKKVPEPKLSKVESVNVTIPLKVPSKVDPPAAAAAAGVTMIPSKKLSYVEPAAAAAAAGATAIPSKKLSYAEPQPPPPSRLPTERAPSSSGKPAAPTPPPEKVISTTDGTRTSGDSTKPAATGEIGRTRTRNLNDRVDEYINRTKNKLRSASNAGGPSSTSK